MTDQSPENHASIVPAGERHLPFQLLETRPTSITWHMIFDHELNTLVNISRPLTLGLATLLIGAALGLLPSVVESFSAAGRGAVIATGGLIVLCTAALCLASGVVCGFFACRGQVDAHRIRNDVRSRNTVRVTPAR